jgi:Uma2 family endonuclease
MSSVMTMPHREWTVDDLDDLPDDGRRYELVDGVLLVSAAPTDLHQLASRNLFRILDRLAPPPMETLYAPVDVVFSRTRVVQPDLMVFPELTGLLGSPKDRRLPLLAVEILSPSTRAVDSTLKRHVCGSTWALKACRPRTSPPPHASATFPGPPAGPHS